MQAPAVGCNRLGPKSGFRSGSVSMATLSPSYRPGGRGFVQVHGDLQFVRDALSHGSSEGDAIVHRDPEDRHEREDVQRADTRVGASVLVHVNPVDRGPRALEGGFRDAGPVPDERDDGTIVIRIHFRVEDPDSRDRRDRPRDFVDDFLAPPFGEVRHAFDNLGHDAAPAAPKVPIP